MAAKTKAAANGNGSPSVVGTDEHINRAAIHLKTMEAKTGASPIKQIKLPQLQIETCRFKVVGDTPLITHAWSEKAIRMMLEKQTGEASAGREKKDPVADYQASCYVIEEAKKGKPFEDGLFGIPAIGFKNAAVTACTSLGKLITKVQARQAFHVVASHRDLIAIQGSKPRMVQHMVRVGMGTSDVRFRAEFYPWFCDVMIRYNTAVLSASEIINLFNVAGFGVGLFEWRPECDGQNGMFHVESMD